MSDVLAQGQSVKTALWTEDGAFGSNSGSRNMRYLWQKAVHAILPFPAQSFFTTCRHPLALPLPIPPTLMTLPFSTKGL